MIGDRMFEILAMLDWISVVSDVMFAILLISDRICFASLDRMYLMLLIRHWIACDCGWDVCDVCVMSVWMFASSDRMCVTCMISDRTCFVMLIGCM